MLRQGGNGAPTPPVLMRLWHLDAVTLPVVRVELVCASCKAIVPVLLEVGTHVLVHKEEGEVRLETATWHTKPPAWARTLVKSRALAMGPCFSHTFLHSTRSVACSRTHSTTCTRMQATSRGGRDGSEALQCCCELTWASGMSESSARQMPARHMPDAEPTCFIGLPAIIMRSCVCVRCVRCGVLY